MVSVGVRIELDPVQLGSVSGDGQTAFDFPPTMPAPTGTNLHLSRR